MTCPICNGSGEAHGDYQVLNCTGKGCTAATERAALEAANKAAEPMTVYDQRWFAYVMGKNQVDLADALNTMLWLYRRLPRGYDRVPCIEKSIKAMAKAAGADIEDYLRERSVIESGVKP